MDICVFGSQNTNPLARAWLSDFAPDPKATIELFADGNISAVTFALLRASALRQHRTFARFRLFDPKRNTDYVRCPREGATLSPARFFVRESRQECS